MSSLEWGGIATPIVTLTRTSDNRRHIRWRDPGPLAWNFGHGTSFKLRFLFEPKALGPHQRFRVWVDEIDENGDILRPLITPIEKWLTRNETQEDVVDITLNKQLLRFKIRAQTFFVFSTSGQEHWDPVESRDHIAYVPFFIDFSLDYIPIAIVYSPPGQDMINTLIQSQEFGTNMMFGASDEVGTRTQTSTSIKGGLRIITGGFSLDGGTSRSSSSSLSNTSISSVSFSHRWTTVINADNNRNIGRSYWGALGDIFVLIKNPWFRLNGTQEGVELMVNEDNSNQQTNLILICAHKLIRPLGDPIAEAIPLETRRALLELDPFITNLNRFFPVDQGDDIKTATNQYADPSAGEGITSVDIFGNVSYNRAEFIAKYALGPGTEIDLSSTEEITVSDSFTNESVYFAQVNNYIEGGGSVGFANNWFTLGVDLTGRNDNGTYLRMSIIESNEFNHRNIKTARCLLTKNQNIQTEYDIQLWYDKQFSTFMFRKVNDKLGKIQGILIDIIGNFVPSIPVELITEKLGEKFPPSFPFVRIKNGLKFATSSDARGRFEFCNIPNGNYILKVGDITRKISFNNEEVGKVKFVAIDSVRRSINIWKNPLWELALSLKSLGVKESNLNAIRNKVASEEITTLKEFVKHLGVKNLKAEDINKLVSIEFVKPKKSEDSQENKS